MKIFLVPTDFSEHAKKALFFALDLAHRTNARVLVTHVYHKSPPLLGTPFTADDEIRQDALERMEAFLDQATRQQYIDVPVDFILKDGNIVTRLSQLIEQNNVSLVIMGTKGAHNQLEKLFGTNTEAVAKRGLCPVIAVPAPATLEPVKHIVYTSTLEHDEVAAMRQLLQIKNIFEARLTILHVNSEDQLDLIDDTDIRNNLSLHFPQESFRYDTIEEDDVVKGIASYVKENPAQLLAFTMLERDIWEKIFLDSVTARLLQSLQIPMLVLPEKGRQLELLQGAAHEDVALEGEAPLAL